MDWAAVGVVVSIVGMVGAALYHFVHTSIRSEMKRTGNGKKSGELDPAFWQLEFRKAILETMGPILDRQTRILEELSRRDTCCRHCGE